MKHPILALALASAPHIVLAAPSSTPPALTMAETYRPVQDLPIVTIRARRIDAVSTPEPGQPEKARVRSRTRSSERGSLSQLEQELAATRIELAHVQVALARLRLEPRATLRHHDPRQCEIAAANTPPRRRS